MVSPPIDYPKPPLGQQEKKHIEGSKDQSSDEFEPITVSSVLDRLDSEQPVTDAMIHKAVTNLHTADTLKNFKPTDSLPSRSPFQRKHARMPHVLRSLIKNVTRN